MWWLAIPATIVLGKIIYDVITEEDSPSPRPKTILESNLDRLRRELRQETGQKIAIMGQPGAGKSSLLKKMTNGEVVPLPKIGIQTDATDWSSDANCTLISRYKEKVFVDVPGYDTQNHPVSVFYSSFPFHDFDTFLLVFHGKLHKADEDIFQMAIRTGKPVCIARSFLDSLDEDEINAIEQDIRKRLSLPETVKFVFFSNRTEKGIKDIFNIICST